MKQGLKIDHELAPTIDSLIEILKPSEGILAGGFLRDYLLEKEWNDIDFFVRDVPSLSYALDEVIPEILGYDYDEDRMRIQVGDGYGGSGIKFVHTFVVRGVTWQFIVIPSVPTSYVSKYFDYSINQVWYDGENIKTSPSFRKTLKTLEVTEKGKVTPERRKEMMQRFPQFKFPEIQEKIKESPFQYWYRNGTQQSLYINNINNITITTTTL